MKRPLGVLLLLATVAWAAGPALAADDFYQQRLEEGRIAFQAGSSAEAVDLLRIACFGLMDQPPLLSEGLVWLELAQRKLDRGADADATLRRFLDVEKRFGAYASASLPPERRKEFERTLLARVPPEAIRAVPTLAPLLEAGALAAPKAQGPSSDALKAQARDFLKAGNPGRAKEAAAAAVAADREDREAKKLLLEAASLASDWKTAAAEAKALSPFRDGEEPSMFYAAVGLYETGDRATARALMERAKPRIAATPFVAYYLEKVLR